MQFLILLAAVSGVLCGVRRQACVHITCDQYKGDPVCGSDGQTYQNYCYLKLAVCKYASDGKHLELEAMNPCRTTVDPIRVTDAPIKVTPARLSSADCHVHATCDDTMPSICGTDGTTYKNKCDFYEAQCKYASVGKKLDIDYTGGCRTGSNPMILDMNPCMEAKLCHSSSLSSSAMTVCGSDGMSYHSKCDFMMAACKSYQNGMTLDVVSSGSCGSKVDTMTSRDPCDPTIRCSNERKKICASDRTTYESECDFNIAVCVAHQTTNTVLTQVRC